MNCWARAADGVGLRYPVPRRRRCSGSKGALSPFAWVAPDAPYRFPQDRPRRSERRQAIDPNANSNDMPQITPKLNPRSEEFKSNAAAMRALVDDLNAHLAKIAQGGGES